MSLQATRQSVTRPPVVLAVLVVALGALLGYYWLAAGGDTGKAVGTETSAMTLGVTAPTSGGCTGDPENPDSCTVEVGESFTVVVRASAFPATGIAGFGAELAGVCDVRVGAGCPPNTLTYSPVLSGQEIVCAPNGEVGVGTALVIPGFGVFLRPPAVCSIETGLAGQPQAGVSSGSSAPFAPLGVVNNPGASGVFKFAAPLDLWNVNLSCDEAGAYEVSLTAAPSSAFGATMFSVPEGIEMAVKTVGAEQLDLDGDTTPETVDVADTLEISCSAPEGGAPLQGPTEEPPSLDTSRWLTYRSPRGYSIQYPPNWRLEVINDSHVRLVNPVWLQLVEDLRRQGLVGIDLPRVPGMAQFNVIIGDQAFDVAEQTEFCERPPNTDLSQRDAQAQVTTFAGRTAVSCETTLVTREGLESTSVSIRFEFPPGQRLSAGGGIAAPGDVAILETILSSLTLLTGP